MDFGESVSSCLRAYASVRGRAPRSEYWWFQFFLVLAYFATVTVDMVTGVPCAFPLACLGLILPTFGVAIRRLHDVDRSGWWYLVSIVPFVGQILLLVWFCEKGSVGENDFGRDPLGPRRPARPALRARRDNSLAHD